MTKEELEHEHIREIAENYVNESWGSYLDLDEVDLVMAGIGVGKIIASEQEKRIADLEKENAELKQQIEKMKCCENCKHYSASCCCNLPFDDCFELSAWELRK